LARAATTTLTINSPTVSKTTRSWQRAISSIAGGGLFGLLTLLVGAPFGYYCILISLALLFVGACLLGYWLGLSALIAVVSASAAFIRIDCGSKRKRCFGNAHSFYNVDFSATQPTQPYRFTFLCWNTSIRVLARLVHRMFARPMYQKEVKLQLADHCRYAW